MKSPVSPAYIAISTVTAVHLSWRAEPGLKYRALYEKALVGGRGSLEIVATLYLVIAIGQILTSVYSQGGEPGLLHGVKCLARRQPLQYSRQQMAPCCMGHPAAVVGGVIPVAQIRQREVGNCPMEKVGLDCRVHAIRMDADRGRARAGEDPVRRFDDRTERVVGCYPGAR